MRLASIIIIEALYCLSYKSHAPRTRPMAVIISPILGNILIKASITAGILTTAASEIDTVKLCETAVTKRDINGDTRHRFMHTNPILLKMVKDLQNVFFFSEMVGQFSCSFFKRFILIISKIRYIRTAPQNT